MGELKELKVLSTHSWHAAERHDIEDGDSEKAGNHGQHPHEARIASSGVWAVQIGQQVFRVSERRLTKRASKVTCSVYCSEEKGKAGHDDVEALTVVPVDEGGEEAKVFGEGGQPSRHGDDHEQQRWVEGTSCCLAYNQSGPLCCTRHGEHLCKPVLDTKAIGLTKARFACSFQ